MIYFRWHYGRGFVELANIFRNYFGFLVHFFSLKFLWKTLFHPWRHMGEGYPKGLNIEAFFSSLIVNLIMRILGFVSRSFILALGVAACLGCLVLFLTLFIFWIFSPLVIIAVLFSGGILIFSAI